jgi:two-component system, LuxR family, sensor kinase FixL
MPIDAASDALFSALIATAVDGIVVIDARGVVQIYSPACERLFGYSPEEVLGENVKLLMPQPFHGEHDQYLANYRSTGERRIIGIGREVVGRRKDRTTFPMYLSVGEGEIGGQAIFVGIIHDLSALRAAERNREASDRHLANIVESSDDIILSKTLDGVVMSWNAAAERIFGYTAGEMIGRPISGIVPPDRLAEEDDILRRVRVGEHITHYETVRRHKDGHDIIVSLSVSPVRDADGKIVGASKIARDVTEQRKAENRAAELQFELLHVSRLSAMGQMTAAIAHEVNQPLTAVANYVSAARRTISSLGNDAPVVKAREFMEKAAEQTLRAGAIVRNLRDFVEKRESQHVPHDINKVVTEAVALGLAGAAHIGVKVRLDLDSTLAPVLIDKIQIQQVLLNLIRNSIEAMAVTPERELVLSTAPDAPGFVAVTVADSGPGLADEVAERLFQPFTTTKEQGMGIGLNICHAIIEDHGGRIWLLPDVRKGASFRIRLPLASHIEGST